MKQAVLRTPSPPTWASPGRLEAYFELGWRAAGAEAAPTAAVRGRWMAPRNVVVARLSQTPRAGAQLKSLSPWAAADHSGPGNLSVVSLPMQSPW